MKAWKDFLVMQLKAGVFPLHCNKTGAFFPSVHICVKKERWRACGAQDECRRICFLVC